ncbi:hypothetical protein [Terricaulis sp.]|uniref:hypothetical protein n=1 Tax=Terricaulis sp. TaxID=2768686 RepID=UPI003783513A
MAQKLSIRVVIGEALRTVRGNPQVLLSVAAAGAAAHGLAFVTLGSSGVWAALLALISAAIYAVLTRFALDGDARGIRTNLAGDTLRVSMSTSIVAFFILIVVFVLLYLTMMVLIGPYAEQAKQLADAKDQAGTQELMQRAMTEQSAVVPAAMIIGGLILFAITSRFFVAVPQSLAKGRVMAFDSWRLTRGALLQIAAARVVLLLPAIIFAGALQSLFAFAIGLNPNDILATAAAAQQNPLAFVAFFTVGQFLQIAIYTSLEAALSVAIFRALAPADSTDSARAG